MTEPTLPLPPYGPFHRKESPTQTAEDARLQVASSEIWGTVPQSGDWPQVQAYVGPLPEGHHGIEFWTATPPDVNGHPYMSVWSQRTRGAKDEVRVEGDYAKIECVITKVVP